MRMEEKKRRMNIILGIILQIYFLFPWMNITGERKNFIMYVIAVLRNHSCADTYNTTFLDGAADALPLDIHTLAKTFTVCVMLYVVLEVIETIRLICNIKGWEIKFLSIIELIGLFAMLSVVAEIGLNSSWSSAGTIQVFPMYLLGYLAVFPIWTGIRLLMHKSMEEWEESGEQILKTQENDKHYKQERKRRLYFPGKYSKLYYHVLWENFKYHWRDFSFLFVSVLLSAAFLFIGFGMREAFSGSYGYDNELLGLGLTEIMKDCLIVIVLISLFLITVVMVFYRKKRMTDDGIFRTLGMRSNAVFWSWIGELLAGFAVALVTAFVIGRAILFGIYAAVIQHFPKIDMKSEVSWKVYLITAIVIAVICLFAFGISGDIHAGERSADVRNAAVKSEKIPGIYRKAGALISGLLGVIVLYLYTQRRFSESIFLLCGFFLCLYVFLYNIGAMILRKKETSMDQYLRTLPEEHMIRHRYQTTVKYLTLMIVIHVCVMSFFSVKVVSNRIADKTDTLYPYDYVWLANSNDTGIIEKLKQECKAEVTSIPMVRATTIDNTERLEGPFDLVWQQGQNIGISESSYRKLKKAVGEKPKKHLNLDKNGKKIYVVYQQDQGTKAKPIDHYQLMIHPNLHIGQPLFGFDTMEHQIYYPVRTITGSETSSLIGAFKQGKYENLIVFADAYFDKIKDYWKTTDMNTGEKIKTSDAVLEENIHEWPTKLVLANVPEKYQKKADQLTIDFAKQHAYDESFDSLVKSTYTKTEAAKKRQMERILECVMNGFVLIILSVISMLLLHMKVQMELPDMRKRYQFMNRLGMNRRERICIEKKEISRFVTIPSVIAVIVTVLYSGIVFELRDYHLNDVKNYVINAGVLWIIYFILQWLNLKWLEDMIVKKIEKGADL